VKEGQLESLFGTGLGLFVMALFLLGSLKAGKTLGGWRGHMPRVIDKTEEPGLYWTLICLLAAGTVYLVANILHDLNVI
jgi:hypothetical protein